MIQPNGDLPTPLTARPSRNLAEDEIAAYESDGAAVIRGIVPMAWIESIREATERVLANPGPFGMDYNMNKTGSGRFYGDLFTWLSNKAFKAFAIDSPLPVVAAEAMGAETVNFFYDQLLVKEPSSVERTPWHQDLPYWPVNGKQIISLWVPMDEVNSESGGIVYVKGSHRWGKWYEPQKFTADETVEEPAKNPDYEPMPDIDGQASRYEFLNWDMQPGDLILHHPLTVHGASGNQTSARRRRAIAMRYVGDDARWDPRPGHFMEHPMVAQHLPSIALARGDRLNSPLFPQVWPRND